jgi:sortase A
VIAAPAPPPPLRAPPALRAPAAAARLPASGALIATIRAPRLGLVLPVYQGVSQRVLDRGPGHYPTTALPGQRGTVGIAAHRVTPTPVSGSHGPFFRINLFRRGDLIVVDRHGLRSRYRVTRMLIVKPTAVWVLHGAALVLTACHPPRTASKRIVVFARLVSRSRLAQADAARKPSRPMRSR